MKKMYLLFASLFLFVQYSDAGGLPGINSGNGSRSATAAGSPAVGITVAGGNGNGSAANQLNDPYDVFVDAAGNVYIAEGIYLVTLQVNGIASKSIPLLKTKK